MSPAVSYGVLCEVETGLKWLHFMFATKYNSDLYTLNSGRSVDGEVRLNR